MSLDTYIDALSRSQVIPVVALDDPDKAVPLANALMAGGIDVIELTLRTETAMDGIKAIKEADIDIVLGVGTVITVDQVEELANIGVDFLVTPGTTAKLIDAIKGTGQNVIPGVSTCSEAVAMLEREIDFVKFFPAEAAGGVNAIKAISGPLPQLKVMPTGGIRKEAVRSYLDVDAIVCVGGSWVTPHSAIEAGDWSLITENAKIATSL